MASHFCMGCRECNLCHGSCTMSAPVMYHPVPFSTNVVLTDPEREALLAERAAALEVSATRLVAVLDARICMGCGEYHHKCACDGPGDLIEAREAVRRAILGAGEGAGG